MSTEKKKKTDLFYMRVCDGLPCTLDKFTLPWDRAGGAYDCI